MLWVFFYAIPACVMIKLQETNFMDPFSGRQAAILISFVIPIVFDVALRLVSETRLSLHDDMFSCHIIPLGNGWLEVLILHFLGSVWF